MDFGLALSFVFQDQRWTEKAVGIVLLTFAGIVPLFGLVAWAILFGYMIALVRNVMRREPYPLPAWTDLDRKFSEGGRILVAVLVYNLPLLFLGICVFSAPGLIGGNTPESVATATLIALCCSVPLMLIYSALAWPTLAIAVIDFIVTPGGKRLYDFGAMWAKVPENFPSVGQWILMVTLLNGILGILVAIPCIGWLLAALFAIPTHGHLLGQFALAMERRRSA
ncbi:MAG: DUF4013 domain-containing protein [Anaerolineae bacterium]|jgi:hypothetical protein|nr:DUF4013 domain-containing protein [Anaerolineae bacterium]